MAVGRADRTVHIKDDLLGWAALVNPVYPRTGQVHQELQILRLGQYLCFESAHDTGRCGGTFYSSATGNMPHGRIKGQTLGVVGVVIACKPALYRLPEQSGKAVLGVLARSNVTQVRISD
jgi:hypothetical protein